MDSYAKELETRLVELLQDFAGGGVTKYEDEGINGDGLTIRIIGPNDTMFEVSISIENVTAQLLGGEE